MNKLMRLSIVPFVTLLACGGGGGGKHSDAGNLDGLAPSGKDAGKLEVGSDAVGPIPDTGVLPAPDALIPSDVLAPDGAQQLDVAAPDAALPQTDTTVVVVDTGLPDSKAPDAFVAIDTVSAPDTVPTLPPDTGVITKLDAASDVSAETAVDTADTHDTAAVDALVVLDTLVAIDTTIPVDTTVNFDTGALVPTLTSISPTTGTAGQALSLTIVGTGFESTSVVQFDGQAVTTTVNSATSLSAQVLASLTTQAGAHAVLVTNGAGRTSNVLYVDLTAPVGAPLILDYNPDNGVVGDTITIIGQNLTAGTTITGPGGSTATPGTTGTRSWLGETVETLTFVVPSGWQTGPIVVSNANGTSRGKIFNVGKNLATLTGVTVEASTEYSNAWAKGRGADNDLGTSWFSANGDCATSTSCTTVPWFKVNFPAAQTLTRIAVRGNREYAEGYDFIRARLDVVGAGGTLWSNSYDLPEPNRDLDITFASPLTGVTSVKFTSLQDESVEPGLSELEVF